MALETLTLTIPSEALGVTTELLLARPAGIERPLPGLVLLRGRPDEWLNPHEDETRGGRSLETVVADLLGRGWMTPLCLVLPRTLNGGGDGFVVCGDPLAPERLADRSFIGTGAFDRALDDELLPAARQAGWLAAGPLAIDGFSLGGAAAVYQAMRRPERYISCGSYDGSFLMLDFDDPRRFPETPSDLRLDRLSWLYGFPPDEDVFRAREAIPRLQRDASALKTPLILHHSAKETPDSNSHRVRALIRVLGGLDQATPALLDPHSDHTWWWVDEHLYRTLPIHSRRLLASSS